MVTNEPDSVLEPLAPLVREGYKALAARALNGLQRWQSSLTSEIRRKVDDGLSSLSLPGMEPATMIYLATVTGLQQRTLPRSGSLLGDYLSRANEQLAALAGSGDAAGINPESFDRLFFALDYSTIKERKPTKEEALKIAFGMAVSYFATKGMQDFINQLDTVYKLGAMRISPPFQGVECADDGTLAGLTFNLSDGEPSIVNIVMALRLLYLAASDSLPKPADGIAGLRGRITSVAEAKVLSVPKDYLQDEAKLQGVATLLGDVALHRGVEDILFSCRELPVRLTNALRLGTVLDTVTTGKISIKNGSRPYSDAIGIAELVA